MTISFTVSSNVEGVLGQHGQDPSVAAKEATLVELYRQDKISRAELSDSLGISRIETDAILKRHHVIEDLPTQQEYEADLAAIRTQLDQ